MEYLLFSISTSRSFFRQLSTTFRFRRNKTVLKISSIYSPYIILERKSWFSDDKHSKNDKSRKTGDPLLMADVKIKNDVAEMRTRFRLCASEATNNEEKEFLQLQSKVWNSLWEDNITPWDIGKPTPALYSEANQFMKELPADEDVSSHEIRILVPGCGAGYDLVTLARHVDKLLQQQENVQNKMKIAKVKTEAVVVGLELTVPPLHRAVSVVNQAIIDASPLNQTRIDLVIGDYFETKGKLYSSVGHERITTEKCCDHVDYIFGNENSYHFIFDYTFFCALPPSLRSGWGKRTAELLVPGSGRLLTLMFPILPIKKPATGIEQPNLQGPPYPVTVQDYQTVLEPYGICMEESGPRRNPDSIKSRAETELACWWKKHH